MNSRPVNSYLAVTTTWDKEGFPITVNVTAEGEVDDPAGDSEYNLRVVVEQLM
jgi:hypothetical protein